MGAPLGCTCEFEIGLVALLDLVWVLRSAQTATDILPYKFLIPVFEYHQLDTCSVDGDSGQAGHDKRGVGSCPAIPKF